MLPRVILERLAEGPEIDSLQVEHVSSFISLDSAQLGGGEKAYAREPPARSSGRRVCDDGAMVDPAEREQTLGRIREICLSLPETSERLSHGAPTFFVRGRDELAGIAEDAYAEVAPARLVEAARLGGGDPAGPRRDDTR